MKTKKETDRKVSSIKFKRFRRNEIVPSRNLQTQLYESKHFIFNQYSVIIWQTTSQFCHGKQSNNLSTFIYSLPILLQTLIIKMVYSVCVSLFC